MRALFCRGLKSYTKMQVGGANQARIQDFGQGAQWSFDPKGGGPWAQNRGLSQKKLPENCMILKKSWEQEGARAPRAPPDPPLQMFLYLGEEHKQLPPHRAQGERAGLNYNWRSSFVHAANFTAVAKHAD